MPSNINLYTITFPLNVNGEEAPLELVEYYHDDNEAIVMGNLIAQLIKSSKYIVINEHTSEKAEYQTIWKKPSEE